MATCSECNEEIKGNPAFHARKHKGGVAVAERPRSQRGQRMRAARVLTPLEQIRMTPQGNTNAFCYFLRPDGATIRDALVISPNGGVPDLPDERMRARYGTNAAEYRARGEAKGFKYLGSKLTPNAVRELIETMAANREDEMLFCQEEIEDCERTIANSDLPQIRDQAKRRRAQLKARIDTMLAPFDADALLEELSEIAQAQMLADTDPNILRVIRMVVGEANEKLVKAVQKFQAGKQSEADPEMAGVPRGTRVKSTGDDFAGRDFIDAD